MRFKEYLDENINSKALAKWAAKKQGHYPKIGMKPKKGDRIFDMGEMMEIDMISRGIAYANDGTDSRVPYSIKDLKPNKNANHWEYKG
jgi:hypothetical protein